MGICVLLSVEHGFSRLVICNLWLQSHVQIISSPPATIFNVCE